MPRPLSKQTTPLSEWLARNARLVSRAEFAAECGILRENLDRLCRAARRPGLDLAFDIEELTGRLTDGWDVLFARYWYRPGGRRSG